MVSTTLCNEWLKNFLKKRLHWMKDKNGVYTIKTGVWKYLYSENSGMTYAMFMVHTK